MLKLIKNALFALAVAGLLFGLGRAWFWVTGTESGGGLSGAAQVFNWPAELAGLGPTLGGYSALIMAADGTTLRAGSDHGFLLDAQVIRDADGQATRLDRPVITPVLSRQGKTLIRFHSDLEGLTTLPGGAMGLAFESYTRLLYLPPPNARGELVPEALHGWNLFEEHFGNRAFEAIATLPSGDMLAILERKPDQTTAESYLYTRGAWRGPHLLPAQAGWAVSGADLGPDGCLYLVERRYGVLTGFQSQLVRLRGTPAPPFDQMVREVLWRSAPLRLGNGEGVSLWQRDTGDIIASIVTDDGFPPVPFGHPTQLIELPLRAAPGC